MLFGRKPLAEMDRSERVRACYLHACLKHVNREFLINASLRKRFDINAATSASEFDDQIDVRGQTVTVTAPPADSRTAP